MKTIGKILQEARLSTSQTLQDIAEKTKIRADFLEAIENEEFGLLPQGPFAKGFIKSYAAELGLDPEHAAAIYRRDFGHVKTSSLVPDGTVKPIKKKVWYLVTPQFLAALFILSVTLSFFLWQLRSFNQPPALVIMEPAENQQANSPVVVRGRTATDAVVQINAQSVALNQDGEFRTELILSPGEHSVVVESTNRKGKSRVVQRIVRIVE